VNVISEFGPLPPSSYRPPERPTPVAGRPLPPGFSWVPAPAPYEGLMMLTGAPEGESVVDRYMAEAALAHARETKAAKVEPGSR